MAATTYSPVELVRTVVDDVLDGQNYEMIEEYYAEDFVQHGGPMGDVRGRDGIREHFEVIHEAFPDFRHEEAFSFADGEYVCSRFTYHGTHEGEFMGVEPTGEACAVTGTVINRVVDGRIVETWPEVDLFGLMVQLGVVPGPE